MYKKLFTYIFFYSLFVNHLFAFSAEELDKKFVSKIKNIPIDITTINFNTTTIYKFAANNKCIRVRIINGHGHSPSYIYIKEENQAEQLLYTADMAYANRYPIIKSPEVIALQDGGYSVFWLVYTQIADEALRMSRFDSNGNMVVNNKFLNTFNVSNSNITIKQLSNENYVVGNCATHGHLLRIRIYDYTSGARLHQFYPSIDYPCNYNHKSKIMPISNNTFVFSLDNKLWHFDNQGNEIPFN